MGTATLNIKVNPRRMLSAREAAEYCGLPLKRFEGCGVVPVAMPDGRRAYDLHDLDAWIDGLKAGSADDDSIVGRLG